MPAMCLGSESIAGKSRYPYQDTKFFPSTSDTSNAKE